MKKSALLLVCWITCLPARAIEPLPESTTFVLVQQGVGGHPKVLYGDEAVLRHLSFYSSPSCNLVFVVGKSEDGGWMDLLEPPTIGEYDGGLLALPVSSIPSIKNSDLDSCLSSIIGCWVKETDSRFLYAHTQRMTLTRGVGLLERYASSIKKESFVDAFKKMCAARILSKTNPKEAIKLCFEALAMEGAGSKVPKEMMDHFRNLVLSRLGVATDASNFEQHWSYLLNAPDEVKAVMLGELTGNPFFRKQDPLNKQAFLGARRVDIFKMLQDSNLALSFEAYVAICMADGTYENTYQTLTDFGKHRDEVIKALSR